MDGMSTTTMRSPNALSMRNAGGSSSRATTNGCNLVERPPSRLNESTRLREGHSVDGDGLFQRRTVPAHPEDRRYVGDGVPPACPPPACLLHGACAEESH